MSIRQNLFLVFRRSMIGRKSRISLLRLTVLWMILSSVFLVVVLVPLPVVGLLTVIRPLLLLRVRPSACEVCLSRLLSEVTVLSISMRFVSTATGKEWPLKLKMRLVKVLCSVLVCVLVLLRSASCTSIMKLRLEQWVMRLLGCVNLCTFLVIRWTNLLVRVTLIVLVTWLKLLGLISSSVVLRLFGLRVLISLV